MNMNIIAKGTAAEQALGEQFAGRASAKGLLEALREAGFARFAAQGLPHRRIEAWKYTDLRALMREAYRPATMLDAAAGAHRFAHALDGADAVRVDIVNGYLDIGDLPHMALPRGVELFSLAALAANPPEWFSSALGSALAQGGDEAIACLNQAFAQDGAVIRVARGVQADKPLHLAFAHGGDAPLAAYSRHLVIAEEGASMTLLESHGGQGAYQSNTVLELIAGDNAHIDHVKVQEDSGEAVHLHLTGMRLGAHAVCRAFALSLGAGVARNETRIALQGEFSHVAATGVFLLRGKQHCDSTLVVDHGVPNCSSSQLFKGVLDGQAKGVFQGKIIVRPHAQKTDGYQSSRALLLSDTAEMNSKPELEIFADDVKCSHGSTTGQIDEDLMFYLRSRGIPEPEAKALLVQAFIGEALETIGNEPVRVLLSQAAQTWLERGAGLS